MSDNPKIPHLIPTTIRILCQYDGCNVLAYSGFHGFCWGHYAGINAGLANKMKGV